MSLLSAVNRGDENTVLALLREGADPNSDYYLHEACACNYLNIAHLLLKYGARVTTVSKYIGKMPLHTACAWNSTDCVKLLMDNGCPTDVKVTWGEHKGKTAADVARSKGYTELAKLVENYKPQPRDPLTSYPSLVRLAMVPEHQDWHQFGIRLGLTQEELTSFKESHKPMKETLWAAKNANMDLYWCHVLEALVDIGAYKAAVAVCGMGGEDPLIVGTFYGLMDFLKFLVETKGLDPKSAVNKAGDTPILLSCANGHLEMAKYLVRDHHCDPKGAVNKAGDTPISLAYKNEHLQTVQYLTQELQCDPNCALLLAVKKNHQAMVECLLFDCHADPNVTDKESRSPITLTTDTEITKLLLKHGAKAEDVYKAHRKIIGKLSSERALDNPLIMLIIGDGGVGKSTLLKSLLNPKGLAAYFTRAKPVTGVDEKTVGIIPYEVETKEFGKANIYDFAGQQEFFATHCAVVENSVQTSSPAILYCAKLLATDEEIEDSTIWWMTLIQNHCTKLEGKAHVIVIGSHADEVKKAQGDPWSKESIFAPIIEKFPNLQFVGFIPMDCRFADSDYMKRVRKLLQKSAAVLRSPETINLNAHSFYIYLLDSFKKDLAAQLKDVQQRIHSDIDQTQSEKMKDILSFIPTTLPRLVEICDQLSKKGLILFLRNKSTPEDSFIVCDRTTLLSEVTGTVFAPENFKQHCHLASSTGVVPLIKFRLQFGSLNIEMLIAFMTHLELCYEIKDKELLDGIVELVGKANQSEVDPDSRYLFFPGLIRIETPKQVWTEDPAMSYYFGWVLRTVQSHQFFDPRSFQVTILRMVVSFGLAPANTLKSDLPSLQRFCSVWKNGISWCDDHGLVYLELMNNGKCFVVKMCSNDLEPEFFVVRSKMISKILATAKDFFPNIETTESIIAPQQVVKHPLQPVDSLTLSTVSDIAKAVLSKASKVKSMRGPQLLQHLLQFEPYAGLDHNILQHIHSDKNIVKDEKISNGFISSFADQATDPDRTVTQDPRMYIKIVTSSSAASVRRGDPKQDLVQALEMWRSETEGTYSFLRETLNKHSVFTGRNPLDLAGVAHEEIHSSILSTAAPPQSSTEPEIEQLLERQKLTSSDVDRECRDDHLLKLSHDLGDWEYTARHLRLTDADIDSIKYDGQSSIELKRHNILKKWKSSNLLIGTATYRLLLKALLESKCNELAVRRVCELIKLNH